MDRDTKAQRRGAAWPGSHGRPSGSEASPCRATVVTSLGVSTLPVRRGCQCPKLPSPALDPITRRQGEKGAWELGDDECDVTSEPVPTAVTWR